jgi:hypothetical protein
MNERFKLKGKAVLGAMVLLLVVLLAATTVSGAPSTAPVLQSACSGTPIISSFSASPAVIAPGETATLLWGMVYNAEQVILMAPGQKTGVATPGQMIVYPDQTSTYTLKATCGRSTVKAQVMVSVVVAPCQGVPTISSFEADPVIIKPGETTTLSWGLVANAQAAVLAGPEGQVGVCTPGQQVVEPSQTTTYVLEAFCGNQVAERYATVVVEGPTNCSGTPNIGYFSAGPAVIPRGGTSTLQWGPVTNASGAYLKLPEGIAGVATPGQTNVQPAQTATYVLYALCGRTILQQQATVYVE